MFELEKINANENIESSYQNLVQTIKKCVTQLPQRNKENLPLHDIITDGIKRLIKEREDLKHLHRRTFSQRKRLRKLYHMIQKKIKKAHKNFRTKVILNELKSSGSSKRAFKKLDTSKQWIMKLKNKNCKNQTITRRELLKIATSFYRDLYKEDNDERDSTINEDVPSKLQYSHYPPIVHSEIRTAINKMKTNKSSGEDGITVDVVKALDDSVYPILTDIFNKILEQEYIPASWKTCTVSLLYKKGDPSDVGNYRPISLLSALYKIFTSIILRRITRCIEENQPREQAGFRRGYSTIDHIFTLTQVIEKYQEFGKSFYLAFIDYSKAFDSIKHCELWKTLQELGIESKYISIIKNIYHNCNAKIKLEAVGEPFPIEKGVRQGDCISPQLFIALLEKIFRNLNWTTLGLNINGEHLNHLRFADDIILLSESHEELQEMITELDKESRRYGLHMNKEKTKAMTNKDKKPIIIEDYNIDYVENYIYLGQNIELTNRTEKEVNRRITLSWKRYWQNKEVFKGDFPMHLKKKIFESNVLPTLTYGCQTWAPNKDVLRKIRTFQRATERSMLGLKLRDRVNSTAIRRKTKIIDALQVIAKLKWKWAGHTARQKDNRWSEKILHWEPRNGQRERGRPVRRWRDDIEMVAGKLWTRTALTRSTWQELEEAYVQSWTIPR